MSSTSRSLAGNGTRQAIGSGAAFGTFGELLQGVLYPSDRDFLVTLPIARWSTATFHWRPGWPLRVEPAHKHRSRALARTMLRLYGRRGGGRLTIHSELPEGKGLASSSADLVATARAVAAAFGEELAPETIEGLLREVEPTDGVMYDDVTAFHHRDVSLITRVGPLPPLTVVGVDEGGTVDTIAFNRLPKPYDERDKREYTHLLDTLVAAVRRGDMAAVGRVATRSAQLNQRLSPRRTLEAVLEVSSRAGALGVVAAHSGTSLGVILADDAPGYADRLGRVLAACRRISPEVTVYRTLPGGT
ncbi:MULTISPECIES: GHMP family kinase ATP-binding protein [unclassified Nonomuraea]|uniref:GHMP family kinase ATP-binding protein n=1 Tax=unclassified Nonomuraea TaxID=2593643 RepID=UPI0035BF4D38